MKHIHRKTERTPAEAARLRVDRQRYQRDKPTPRQLLKGGNHKQFVPLGELMFLHEIMFLLKRERQRQKLTLAELAKRAAIDQAALSRLETASHGNPTLDTVYRIADALGKRIQVKLRNAAK